MAKKLVYFVNGQPVAGVTQHRLRIDLPKREFVLPVAEIAVFDVNFDFFI